MMLDNLSYLHEGQVQSSGKNLERPRKPGSMRGNTVLGEKLLTVGRTGCEHPLSAKEWGVSYQTKERVMQNLKNVRNCHGEKKGMHAIRAGRYLLIRETALAKGNTGHQVVSTGYEERPFCREWGKKEVIRC